MARGAAVIRREGKRGVTFSIKWRDHDGRQCWERLGRAPQWTDAKAQRELGKRLERVDREQWRKPGGITFAEFADRFTTGYLPGRNLKPSTVTDYGSIITGRLIPFFGDTDISRIDAVAVDAYIAYATSAGLSPKTVKNHLGVLRVMLKVARRWRLVHANPVEDAEMPRVEVPEMSILTDTEIATLLATYRRLELDAEDDAEWWRLARHVVEFALGTAMRRGEINRPPLARRRTPRPAPTCPRSHRPRTDRHAEKPNIPTDDGTRAAHRRCPRRGLEGQLVPLGRFAGVRAPRARHADRPDEALPRLHAPRVEGGRDHEAVPALA
jgi:integrase-like protein